MSEKNSKIMPLAVFRDEWFERHQTPYGHPERPARLKSIDPFLEELQLPRFEFSSAQEADLRRVHTQAHIERVRATQGQSHMALDPDTHTSADSYEAALKAAGACMGSIDALFQHEAAAAFAFVRPPGHHAESNRAMGFCLFNNVAVAAAYAREKYRLNRIAIIDWDVHHGNGTQEIFYNDPTVLYVSTHQYPFYPGTGAFAEAGRDAGRGFTFNLPLPAGMGDADYLHLFRDVIMPVLTSYQPELVIVSAGYDAYVNDPLGGMAVTSAGFGALTQIVQDLSLKQCPGKLAFALEGGYDLEGLRQCVAATVHALLGKNPQAQAADPSRGANHPALETVISKAREVHSNQWRF